VLGGSAGLPGLYRPLGETEHVSTLCVLGSALELLGGQLAIWINLAFESS
jgi:hypothetical protein